MQQNPIHSSESTSPRRGWGCLSVILMGIAGLGFIGLAFVGVGSSVSAEPNIGEVPKTVEPGVTAKLVIMKVRGPLITGGDGVGRAGASQQALDMLDRALNDDDVVGVLLEIDTPGGSVTDADLIHNRISRLRKQGKEVLVLMGDLCASGGYYAAVAGNRIWALPTSVTGSIGVIISSLSAEQLLATYGIVDQSITTGPNKNLLSPTKTLSPEQRSLLQGIADQMYDRFVSLVAEGRELSVEDVRTMADGRIMTAQQALDSKLIDAIGYHEDALKELKSLAGGGTVNVVEYKARASFVELLGVSTLTPSRNLSLATFLPWAPRAMYMYAPLNRW